MDDRGIYEALTAIFDDVFGIYDLRIGPETTAADVDGWDSLNHIRIMVAVQKKFNVSFSASEIGGLKTVGDLVQLIQIKA